VQTLPSGRGSGLVLAPFRAVRYDLSRVSDLANVTSPPYDVIGPGTLEELLAASPYNVVRLILPAIELDSHTAGSVAASRLGAWLASGVLGADDRPAVYVYEQSGPGFTQRGLIGLVGVGDPGILPHEAVMPAIVTGRRELMMATRANLEPIFLVYNGSDAPGSADGRGAAGPTSRLVDTVADQRPPLVSAVTSDGITHRLWRVDDPAVYSAIADDLAGRTALIADGHHRYAAYRELRDLMRGSGHGAGPWDYGLAFLVDADAYPPRLGAIHRVLPSLPVSLAAQLAGEAFTVTEVPGGSGAADLGAALERLAAAGRDGPAFLLAGESGFRLLTGPDPAQLEAAMPAEASPRWRALDASVLQELLLARLWSIKDNERDVLISHDAGEAVRMAREGGGTAVICNPMPLTAVMEVAGHGECVPRKSTSFGPKPRTGLVLRTFEP
jgi:uncharacterized protein (DUF1015 family)